MKYRLRSVGGGACTPRYRALVSVKIGSSLCVLCVSDEIVVFTDKTDLESRHHRGGAN
jgi:hypothetical protein